MIIALSRLMLCGLMAATLAAADAPTQAEWQPVIDAIAKAQSDAAARLADITTRYPTWPEGWVERSRLALASKRPDEAWKYARQALSLQRGNGEAAALGVQALTAQGRSSDALKVAEPFLKDRTLDQQANGKTGYVNYYAAYAALAAKDQSKGREHLSAAQACAGKQVPAEFHVLDARFAIQANDLVKAEASLARATTVDARCWDGWYELGRVRHALAEAESSAAGKRIWLDRAEQAFATVTKALPEDFESWLGLGRAQAAIARLEIEAGSDGGGYLRDAVASLGEAVRRQDTLVAGWVTLGEAQVRLERYAEAATSLSKARALGANEPSMLHNLAQALQKSGRAEEALVILKSTTATSGSELVSQGMGYYRNHLYPVAVDRLENALAHPDLASDDVMRGQVLRFTGHAWREWGDDPQSTAQEREQRRAKAAAAYRSAGDLGDVMAQRHYAALLAEDGPQSAYVAGWTVLGWNSWLSGSGWALVIGNYGAARAWANGLHYTLWGLFIGLPLVLWIASLFRPKVVTSESRQREPSDSGIRGSSSSQTRAPNPAPKREIDPLTTRKSRPPSEPPRRLPTTEDARAARARASAPVQRRTPVPETEEIIPPTPKKRTPVPETETIVTPPKSRGKPH